MSFVQTRRCPRPRCDGDVTIAQLDVAEHGGPIWTCSQGHHGPSMVPPEPYSMPHGLGSDA